MAKKAVIEYLSSNLTNPVRRPVLVSYIETTSNLVVETHVFHVAMTDYPGGKVFWTKVLADIVDYAVNTLGYTGFVVADVMLDQTPMVFPDDIPSLANAPQPAIGNAPADATTNYNVVTTLLGSLTGAVNTANTKQNDIATRLNTLLTELRNLGLIAA